MSPPRPTSPTVSATVAPARLDVVHVVTALGAGGAERQLELLTARSRHASTVVALYDAGPVADAMRAAGRPVLELRATGWRKLVAPLLLARLLRRLRPDVVHVHLLSGQAMGIPAARLAGVPLVVSTEHSLMHDQIEGRPHRWWLRALYRALERLATHTVAVSDTTAGLLRRWGVDPRRITTLPLGVDLAAVAFDAAARRAVREQLDIGAATCVIGVVGRLAPVKRVDVALRACAPALRGGAVLVVAGSGPLEADLRRLAAELGVADAVRWIGSVARIGPVLSALDVLLSASGDESFGMAVVEGLGNGLPVVYADCPALEELDERPARAVRVAPSDDLAADAERLGTAVAEALRDAGGPRAGRRPVPSSLAARYGAQAAADRVDDLYDRLSDATADRRRGVGVRG